MRLMQNTNINFVGMRKGAYVISGILILAAIIGLAVRGLNWSIDFTSGVAAKVDLKALDTSVAPIQIDELRTVLKNNGFPEAEIQHVGIVDDATFMIKIKSAESKDEVSGDTKTAIIEIIKTNFPK
ncbi:MAG: protein translocase subunit SecF, partial [Candidatus Cloacimonadaceae bacterium]|nr:protein translocase subunit SecF [Candidatus Cloacimonadota bacterium]